MNKVLLLWDRMGDYHRARWKAVHRQLAFDKVFAADLGKSDNLYGWKNTELSEHFFVLSSSSLNNIGWLKPIIKFVAIVKQHNIQNICIPGYGRFIYLMTIIYTKLSGRKVLLFVESWYGTNPVFNSIKGLFLNKFVDVFFVSGIRAKKHFEDNLGIPSNKIQIGYSVIDNQHFATDNRIFTQSEKPILLCVARFVEDKNLLMLIRAFKKSSIALMWTLRIVGGGPLKKKLLQLIDSESIEIKDWVAYRDLPELYQTSSCFVLPSVFEPWGLVVNEAMAAGLPIIVSEQCGCCPDLVFEDNGWAFDALQENELIAVLDNLEGVTKEELVNKGQNSKKYIENYSTENWAKTIFRLFENANN